MEFPKLPSALEFVDIAAELDQRSRGTPMEMPKTKVFAEFLQSFLAVFEARRSLSRFDPNRAFAHCLHVSLINHALLDESDTDTIDMIPRAKQLATDLLFLAQRGWKNDLDEIRRVRDVCLDLSGRVLRFSRAQTSA